MRILGIDPGTNLMGYAVISIEDKQVRVIEIGTLSLRHLKDQPSKLQHIFQDTKAIIERHNPEVMAIETPFYAQNVQSMFKLGRAQGVAIAAAMYQGIPVTEYSPKKIKQSVTGNGNASKEQVAAMLATILNITFKEEFYDATDALSIALCHHYQSKFPGGGAKGKSGWGSFVKENPGRVKK